MYLEEVLNSELLSTTCRDYRSTFDNRRNLTGVGVQIARMFHHKASQDENRKFAAPPHLILLYGC